MNNDLIIKIFKRTIIWSFLIIGIFALVFRSSKPYIFGYIFGVLIAMAGFKLLHNSINKSVNMIPTRARLYATSQYVTRLTIYSIVLVISAKADYLDFFSTFLGLLMIKIVIVSATIFDKKFLR